MARSLRRRFTPVLDQLEHRNVLAGNVLASVKGGVLELLGDAEVNQISVVFDAKHNATISALDDTTINGLDTPVSFQKVKGLTAFMREGDDVLDVSNGKLTKPVNIYMGADNDTLLMTDMSIAGKSTISLGDGDDTADLLNVKWGERTQFLGGAGLDNVTMSNVKGGERTTINLGDDDDTATITDSTFNERFQLLTGAGNDSLTMDNIKGGERTVINLGDGDDTAVITDSTFKERFQLLAGAGDDRVSIGTTRIGNRSQLDGGAGSDDLGLIDNHFGRKIEIVFWQTTASNLLPTAVNDTATVGTGGQVVIDLAGNDLAPGGTIDPTTITIVTDPSSGTVVVNGDGTVTYTHDGSATTSDFFEYTIQDSNGNVTNVARVDVTIEAATVPPTAADDIADVLAGASVVIPVSTNDTAGSSDLDLTSIVIVSQPANGTAQANADGTITYTHNGSATTSDTFTYTIKDLLGVESNLATVTINITPQA